MIWYSTVQSITVRPGTTFYHLIPYNKEKKTPANLHCDTVQYGTMQCSTIQFGTGPIVNKNAK